MTPTTSQESNSEHVTLDLTEPRYQRLADLAKRTSTLLEQASTPERIAVLDDFLGVIYSLIFATHGGFQDRTGKPIEILPVKTRAQQLATGKVRITGAWMAGYHFNSALFRTSAVYHRILKVINAQDAGLGTLLRATQQTFMNKFHRTWDNANIGLVREQVNNLKHEAHGTYHARQVSYEQAVTAAEELLDLLEGIA